MSKNSEERAIAFRKLWITVLDEAMTGMSCGWEDCTTLRNVMGASASALRDLLSDKKVREQLKKSRSTLKTMLDNVPETVVSDSDVCYLIYNTKTCAADVRAMFGFQAFEDDKALLLIMSKLQIAYNAGVLTAMMHAVEEGDMDEARKVMAEMMAAESALTDNILASLRSLSTAPTR